MRRAFIIALSLVVFAAPAAAQVRFHGEASGANLKVMSWRDIPFRSVVRQQYDFSCGSAALATLLTHHYSRPTSEADAFQAMFATGDQDKIRRVGFSMLDMKRYLDARGIRSDGFRLTLDEIGRRAEPVIALIDLGRYRHFVVIKGVARDKVLVGDPAFGLKAFPRAEFSRMWNGVAFGLYPDPAMTKPAFNLAADWSPWSKAPLDTVVATDSLAASANAFQATYYQLTPLRAADLGSIGR